MYRLTKVADKVNKNLHKNNTTSFESVLKEFDISEDEVNNLLDSVDVE